MPRRQDDHPVAPRQAVASAIQGLVAARLGRGFVPAGLLFLGGLVELAVAGLAADGALLLSIGALLSAGAMLAHGLRGVQRAVGRRARPWMTVARRMSGVPFLYGLYVLGWRGLRQLAVGQGLSEWSLGIVFAVMGTWVLRSWMRVVEVERLARLMTFGLEEKGEGA